MSEYRFLVKGAYFRGREAKELSDSLEEDAAVTVKRDSENEHDEYACSVWYEDVQIGYVQVELSFAVAALFDEDGHKEVEGFIINRVQGPRTTTYPEVELKLPAQP